MAGAGSARRLSAGPDPSSLRSCAIALVGIATLPGYKTSYNDRLYLPNDIPANLGYAAADRHFSQSRMMPEILMVEANHDMRNPADFLVLHKLAKGIFHVPGVSRVSGITRPEGTPIQHTSIPFMLSMQNAGQMQDVQYMKARNNDMLKQAEMMKSKHRAFQHMYELTKQLNATTHHLIGMTKEMTGITTELNGNISRILMTSSGRYKVILLEKHCYDIPICLVD